MDKNIVLILGAGASVDYGYLKLLYYKGHTVKLVRTNTTNKECPNEY